MTPISPEESFHERKDDLLVEKVLKDIGRLEEAFKTLDTRQSHIFSQIESEKEDHFYIKSRVELLKNKLEKIEACVHSLKNDGDDRAGQVSNLSKDINLLMTSIEQINVSLNNLNTGTHAAVHKWVENQMFAEKERQEIRKKIYEALITKVATAIFIVSFLLLALGIIRFFEGNVPSIPGITP